MKNIKYTSDGKKVLAIEELNSKEWIVREICVADGKEIACGEKFTASNLSSSPRETWKQKTLRELEERFGRESNEWRRKIERQRKTLKAVSDTLKSRLEYLLLAEKNANEDSFKLLIDFITGNITHLIIDNYSPKLITIDDFLKGSAYNTKYLRLISIFGKDDGTFTYAQGRYSDMSGGSTTFIPCRSYEEAVGVLKDVLSKKPISQSHIDMAEEHGIELPAEKVNKYHEGQVEGIIRRMQAKQSELNELNGQLKETRAKIKYHEK